MTEAEWLACQDDIQLFTLFRSHSSLRKWRQASLATARLLPLGLQGAEIPVALDLVANIIDGCATLADAEAFLQKIAPDGKQYTHAGRWALSWWVGIAWSIVDWVRPTTDDPLSECQLAFLDITYAVAGAVADPDHINDSVRSTSPTHLQNVRRAVSAQVCPILRDIFGNPFRRLRFAPAWRTDTARTLARQMYDSRDFTAAPILADALQDAGCDYDDLLNHLRDPDQPHVRGCWAVDLVLEKL